MQQQQQTDDNGKPLLHAEGTGYKTLQEMLSRCCHGGQGLFPPCGGWVGDPLLAVEILELVSRTVDGPSSQQASGNY